MQNGERKIEIGGDVYRTVLNQGNNVNINQTSGNISIDKSYLDRMPTEYAESLRQFSDFLTKQIQQEKISPENAASVKQSIDKLAKVTADVNLKEGVNENKKRSIRDRLVGVGEALARLSPKIAQAVIASTPLAPFSNLIGEAVGNIVQAAM
jgi:hypothetical protein